MKQQIKTVELKDLCLDFKKDIVDGPFGSNLKRQDYKTNGIPVLKIQNIKPFKITYKKMDYVNNTKFEELKRHSYEEGDIIMTKLGDPLGASAMVEDSKIGLIVADLVRIRAKKINTKFLCYHLNSPQTQDFINSKQKGTTRPRVRISDVRELPIFTPPLPEQQRIVDILDQSFAAIDQAIENTDKSIINVQELFSVTLDQFISNYSKTWPNQFVGDVAKVIAGQSPEGKFYNNKGIGLPFYQGKKEFTEKFLGKPTTWTSKISKEALENDILMSVRAPVGPVNIATEKICIGRGLAAIRPSKYILRDYLFYFFISNQSQLVGNSGAVFNSINKNQIEKIIVPVPPIKIQLEFVDNVNLLSNSINDLISAYYNKNALLVELKQSILHKAFQGELS